MSSDQFRRLGRKDSKREIKASKGLPTDDFPDFSELGESSADVDDLASMPQGLIAKPLKIAPEALRYPPLAPASEAHEVTRTGAALRGVPAPRASQRGLNLLTTLALTGTVLWCAVVALIWQDPYSLLNPLAPPILFVQITATFQPATPVPQGMTQITPDAPLSGAFPFALSAAGITYVSNANGRACEWASIGGTVQAADGSALNGYRIRITGVGLDNTVFSGTATAFGGGGYEFPLGAAPTEGMYSVQLFSPQGAPISALQTVQTVADCARNVVLLAFMAQ